MHCQAPYNVATIIINNCESRLGGSVGHTRILDKVGHSLTRVPWKRSPQPHRRETRPGTSNFRNTRSSVVNFLIYHYPHCNNNPRSRSRCTFVSSYFVSRVTLSIWFVICELNRALGASSSNHRQSSDAIITRTRT